MLPELPELPVLPLRLLRRFAVLPGVRRCWLLLAALWLGLAGSPGGAPLWAQPAEEQNAAPAGLEWSYLTKELKSTSSPCIGRPETPLCAVETFLACFQRNQPDVCALVDPEAESYREIFIQPSSGSRYLAYRVLAQQLIRAGQIPDHLPMAQDGDVLLTLDQREGRGSAATSSRIGTPSDFLLRRQGNGWWLIIWWGESSSDGTQSAAPAVAPASVPASASVPAPASASGAVPGTQKPPATGMAPGLPVPPGEPARGAVPPSSAPAAGAAAETSSAAARPANSLVRRLRALGDLVTPPDSVVPTLPQSAPAR